MASSDKALTDLHATALAQFKFIAETEHDQRERELEALRFQAGDQWTEDAKTARAGLPANAGSGSPAVPARPMLTMRTLDQPIAQVVNQEHDADLGITITARDGKANKDTAEVIAGLIRAIQTDSHADDVYSWGFQRMVGCGRGYWRVNKAYANEKDGLDQVIRIEPIENGFSVYRDPLPKWQANGGFWEPDYCFVTQDMPEADYKREFGESKLAKATDGELLEGLGDNKAFWVLDDPKGGKTYRIAEYWYAVYKTVKAADGREVQERTIKWAKMNGVEWLEAPQEWDGHFIPVVLDAGNQYNVGGEVIYEGMVQPAISPCRMLNFMVSAAAEDIGTSTLAPWIVAAGQLQGFESFWDQANVRNFPYLQYNATTADTMSQILPPPVRNNSEPGIGAYTEMMGVFMNFVRSTTGVPDAALGNVNPNDRSGKAIEELKMASQQGTSGWLTHHARAIRQTGIIAVDLLPHVYDRPGRVERIIGKDGSEETVILNAPFVKDDKGQPKPAPEGFMQKMKSAVGLGGPEPMAHMLAEGRYGVIVNVGKSQQTLKAEAFTGMTALSQAAPELVPRFADLWVKSMDIPQAEEIAARIKPPGVDDPNGLPPEAQAMVAQMQAQMQELQQLADDNMAKLKIAELNAQAKQAESQQEAQVKLAAQQSADHTKLEIAGIQAQSAMAVAELKAGVDEMKNVLQLVLKKMDVAHDTHMHAEQAQEDREARVMDHQMGEHSSEREHERAREMQDREQAFSRESEDREDLRLVEGQGHEREMQSAEHGLKVQLAVTPPPKDPNKPKGPAK